MITAPRAFLLLTGAAVAVSAPPAVAQVPDAVTINILRECAKIDDPTARLACYDNNIRATGANPRSIPGQMARPNGGGAVLAPNSPGGFGADDIKAPERFHPYGNESSRGPEEITTRVSAVAEREPGVYLVTLDSGAKWLFAESTSRSYQPPKRGDTVRIEHGALGSYMLVVNHQQGVKVTRVK
jgi:hypothetical protein